MVFKLVQDMGWGAILIISGWIVMLYSFPVIVGVETMVYKSALFKTWKKSLGMSFLVNLVSGGIGLAWYTYGLTYMLERVLSSLDTNCSYYTLCDEASTTINIAIVIYLVMSVFIEGITLLLIQKDLPVKKTLGAVFISNFLSYILIYIYLRAR